MAWKGLFTVLALFFITYVIADEYGYDEDDHWHEDDHYGDDHYGDDHYEDDHYEDEYSAYGPSQQGSRYGNGYGGYGGYGGGYGGRGYGRGGRGYSGFDGPQRGVRYGPGYSGLRKNGPGYGYKGSSQFYKDGVFGGKGPHIAGGRFGLGRGGIKSALAPITNAALHGNFNPLGNYGYGGYGGLENYAGKEINRYRLNKGLHALNPDDLDGDGEDDHLTHTKHKIDDYLAKQWLMGKRKLTVSVDYGNMPLEYQYLGQYHGFPNPIAGTPLGKVFGLPVKSRKNHVPVKTPNKGNKSYGNNYGNNRYGGGNNKYSGGNYGGRGGQAGHGGQGGHGGQAGHGGQGGHGGHGGRNPQFRQGQQGQQQSIPNQQQQQQQQQQTQHQGGQGGLQPLTDNYVPPNSQGATSGAAGEYVPPAAGNGQ